MAKNRVIGREGDLPWHIPADLKRFKRLTMGHPIVMGRKTYESIGRPLPGRRSIVISRNPQYTPDGVEVVRNLDRAIDLAAGDDEVFIIGGSSIYALALPLANRLFITQVEAEIEGDVYFPIVDFDRWRLVDASPTETEAGSGLEYRFMTYEKAMQEKAAH